MTTQNIAMSDPAQAKNLCDSTLPPWQGETLQSLEDNIRELLGVATLYQRGFNGPLSKNELEHAARWAKFVVAVMSQAKCQAAAAAEQATINALLNGLRAESIDRNDTHSAFFAIDLEVARTLQTIRQSNVPLALRSASFAALGVK